MKKNTPILIVGFGSIGSRHYANLRSLGYTNLAVYDSDKKKLAHAGVAGLSSLSRAACKRFSVVFVCNPTDKHIPVALMAAEAGCHLFIEKPLSHSSKSIPRLMAAMHKGRIAMVACNNRFHPGFKRLETLLKSKKLGAAISATATFTRDITRGGKDKYYAKGYAAQKKGGGIMLDLGAHVVEYLSALFGEVSSVTAHLDRKSTLRTKAEDFAAGILKHTSGVTSVFALDHYRKVKKHMIEVQCERGDIALDIADGSIAWYDARANKYYKEFVYKGVSPAEARNDMYQKQLVYFLACVKRNTPTLYGLPRAARVVRVIESIKRAGLAGTRQRIGQ